MKTERDPTSRQTMLTRFRPTRRLRLINFRPPGRRMRARNPCLRARLILLFRRG